MMLASLTSSFVLVAGVWGEVIKRRDKPMGRRPLSAAEVQPEGSAGMEMDPQAFHYHREDRLKMGGRQDDNSPLWHKKHRGHLILVIDLVVIFIFFVVYTVFLRPDTSSNEIGNYRFELRALEFDGETLANLKMTALQDFVAGSSGLIRLELSASKDFSRVETRQELLPETENQSRNLRFRLPLNSTIYARGDILSLGAEGQWDFRLFTAVEPE